MTNYSIEEMDRMYVRVFEGHAEAAIVLDNLIHSFGGNLFVQGGEEGRRQTDYNLGKRAVLDFILDRINRAKRTDDGVNDE